jgi:hypothetical protein
MMASRIKQIASPLSGSSQSELPAVLGPRTFRSPGRPSALQRTKSGRLTMRGLLKWLLFIQLGVATLQLPLRAMIVDIAFLPDIFVVVSLVVFWGLWTTSRGEGRLKFNWLDIVVGAYFVYGLLSLSTVILAQSNALQSVLSGLPSIGTFLPQWRATFFPVAVFFVARAAIQEDADVYRFLMFFKILAAILMVDIIGEFLWIQVAGFPSSQIPWYSWVFLNDVRFLGNLRGNTPVAGASDPNTFSAIIGILGWSNYTAAAVAALILVLKGMEPKDLMPVREPMHFLARLRVSLKLGNTWLMVGLAVCLLILGNRTPVLAVAVGFLLISRKLIRAHMLITVPVVIALFVTVPILWQTVEKMYQLGFVSHPGVVGGRSELQVILENWGLEELGHSPSIGQLIFGDLDISNRTLGENRIVHYTLSYGLLWLSLILLMFGIGLSYCWQFMRRQGAAAALGRVVGTSLFGLLFVYLIDSIHYSSTMVSPHIFFWSASLGVLSALWSRTAMVGKPTFSRVKMIAGASPR